MNTTLNMALIAAASLLASATLAATPSTATYSGHELAGSAKLSLEQARAVALKARPGKIVDQELEKEAGGSGLRYSFDIKSDIKSQITIYEIGIDAVTGKVLENGSESA